MSAWTLAYDGFDPTAEGLREALCTLGNGYVATRGAAPEAAADDVHYPGTYVAGCYDRLTSQVAGRQVENEDVVNLPNWLPLTFRINQGRWFQPGAADLPEYRQSWISATVCSTGASACATPTAGSPRCVSGG